MKVSAVLGSFDWFGLDACIDNDRVTIQEGRIGLSNKPLTITNEEVSGGYYFPETSFYIKDDIQFVDVALHEPSDQLLLIVRADPWTEHISEEYRLLLPLMRREMNDGVWQIAHKEYVYEESSNG